MSTRPQRRQRRVNNNQGSTIRLSLLITSDRVFIRNLDSNNVMINNGGTINGRIVDFRRTQRGVIIVIEIHRNNNVVSEVENVVSRNNKSNEDIDSSEIGI